MKFVEKGNYSIFAPPNWSVRLVWSGRQVFILVTGVQIPYGLP